MPLLLHNRRAEQPGRQLPGHCHASHSCVTPCASKSTMQAASRRLHCQCGCSCAPPSQLWAVPAAGMTLAIVSSGVQVREGSARSMLGNPAVQPAACKACRGVRLVRKQQAATSCLVQVLLGDVPGQKAGSHDWTSVSPELLLSSHGCRVSAMLDVNARC